MKKQFTVIFILLGLGLSFAEGVKKMDYSIVKLEEKKVAGFSCVTNNSSPDMSAKIGGLWGQLYGGNFEKLSGRVNAKAIGLYCDYAQNGDYTVLAGFEMKDTGNAENEGLKVKTIPGGKYAKFVVKGDVAKAVGKTWIDIWNTPLERTYTGDFEEYQEDCAGGSGTIFIYIAIK